MHAVGPAAQQPARTQQSHPPSFAKVFNGPPARWSNDRGRGTTVTDEPHQRSRSDREAGAARRWRGPTEVITREGGRTPPNARFWWFFHAAWETFLHAKPPSLPHFSGFLVVFDLFTLPLFSRSEKRARVFQRKTRALQPGLKTRLQHRSFRACKNFCAIARCLYQAIASSFFTLFKKREKCLL